MGKQRNIRLRATVGNVIYYQWKGIDCIRTVPVRVRQTANTKKAASLFGIAVKSAAKMRGLLCPLLPGPSDRGIIYELDNAFRKWLHTRPQEKDEQEDNLSFFQLFSFNRKAVVPKVFKEVRTNRGEGGTVEIIIPPFNPLKDITAPAGTARIAIKLMAVILPFRDGKEAYTLQNAVSCIYEDKLLPQQLFTFPQVTNAKTLVILAMALQFYHSTGDTLPIRQMRWRPVVITGSLYN